jgi:hypothetical protein
MSAPGPPLREALVTSSERGIGRTKTMADVVQETRMARDWAVDAN